MFTWSKNFAKKTPKRAILANKWSFERSLQFISACLCFISFLIGQTTLLSAQDHALVLLRGACSAGKTTICEKLKTQANHWKIIDIDELYIEHTVALTESYFPKEFQIIAEVVPSYNLYHVLKRSEIALQGEAQEALLKIQHCLNGPLGNTFRTEVRGQVEALLITQIESAFADGKNVLMDTWLPEGSLEEYFKGNRIFNVLIYTPFTTGFQFLQKRNEEALNGGNLYSKRFVGQFFTSFQKLYQLTTIKSGLSLSEYHRSDIESIFETAKESVTQNWELQSEALFTQSEINLLGLEKIRQEFIPASENGEESFLEPRHFYDLVICTSNQSTDALVTFIIEKIDHLSKSLTHKKSIPCVGLSSLKQLFDVSSFGKNLKIGS